MLTRLLETAANAADAAQSGSNGADLTQLTNILDWFMIVLLPAVALYLFYTVFRLRRDRVLFDNKLLYPGGCTKDDCLDPDGFIDYILPRLIIMAPRSCCAARSRRSSYSSRRWIRWCATFWRSFSRSRPLHGIRLSAVMPRANIGGRES